MSSASGSRDRLVKPRLALSLLMLSYGVNFADRTIINTVGEAIKRDLVLTDAELGILGGLSFAVLYAVMSVVAARVADRSNRVKLLTGAIVVWSFLTMLCAASTSYLSLLLMRIGVGVGEAGCSPPAQSLVADYYPPEKRATAVAIYSLGVPLGIIFGAILGGKVAEAYGWRMAFLVVGSPGLLLALALILFMREPERGRFDSGVVDPYVPTIREVIVALWTAPGLRHGVAGYTLSAMGAYSIGQFLHPFLVRQHHISYGNAAIIFGLLMAVPSALGIALGGYLADRFRRFTPRAICLVPAWGALLAGPFLAAAFLQSNVVGLAALMMIGGTLQMFYQGPSFAMLHNQLPARARATASSIMLFLSTGIGLGLGPLLVGLTSDAIANRSFSGPGNVATNCVAAIAKSDVLKAACGKASSTGVQYALVFVSFIYIWAAIHYFLAARGMRATVEVNNEA